MIVLVVFFYFTSGVFLLLTVEPKPLVGRPAKQALDIGLVLLWPMIVILAVVFGIGDTFRRR